MIIYGRTFQAGLIIVVLIPFRGLLTWTNSELPPALRFSVLIFITITMMLANLFKMYGVIPHLDKIEHLLSGVILFFVGQFILIKMVKRKGLGDLPSNMAGMWEIYEFTVDHLFGFNSQNGSLRDNMICGTLSAAVAAFYLYDKARRTS